MLLCKSTGNNQDLLHSRPRTAPDFVAQVMQEGAQMKGFFVCFYSDGNIIAIFCSVSQVLMQPPALVQPTRILVLWNPSVPVPYNSLLLLKPLGKCKEFRAHFNILFNKDIFGPVWFGFQRQILSSSHISGCWSQEKSSFSQDSPKMLKYHEAQWAPSMIPGMSVLPRKMEGIKWIQGHIPSY